MLYNEESRKGCIKRNNPTGPISIINPAGKTKEKLVIRKGLEQPLVKMVKALVCPKCEGSIMFWKRCYLHVDLNYGKAGYDGFLLECHFCGEKISGDAIEKDILEEIDEYWGNTGIER